MNDFKKLFVRVFMYFLVLTALFFTLQVNFAKADSHVMVLEAKNTVVLQGIVDFGLVEDLKIQLMQLSEKLPPKEPIYMVIDTPGGSVTQGFELIQFVKALPRPVHTITLFSASIGFIVVQNLNTRFIAVNGVLMNHPMEIRGLSGKLNGEFWARYHRIKQTQQYLETATAKRLRMPLGDYRALINTEYWAMGFDAVDLNMADEQVLLICGSSLEGTYVDIQGGVRAKCPLFRPPPK